MSENRAVEMDGVGVEYATFDIDGATITYDADKEGGSAQVGLAVTLSDDLEVMLVGDGEAVKGKLVLVEGDDRATVQIGGYMTLPSGTAAGTTLGQPVVGDLLGAAEGYVREVVASGATYDQAEAQEALVARGEILHENETVDVDGTSLAAVGLYV